MKQAQRAGTGFSAFICLVALAMLAGACDQATSSAAASTRPASSAPASEPDATGDPELEADSGAKIDAAEQAGAINHETALLYKLYASLDYASLPEPFHSTNPAAPEATPVLAELGSGLGDLSPEVRAKVEPFLLRPTDPASFWQQQAVAASTGASIRLAAFQAVVEFAYEDAEKTNVRIWYANPLGVTERALAAQLADEIDRSEMWAKERTAMLGHEPCSDGKLTANGGDARLDIYLVYPSTGVDWGGRSNQVGFNSEGTPNNGLNVPDGSGDRCSVATHILVNAALDFEHLKSTTAHELFHSFQQSFKNAYLPDRSWWMEASATWAKDLVYPEQNFEQNYLPNYWSGKAGPEGSIDSVEGTAAYATYLLPFYLVQKSGDRTGTIVGRLWQASETQAPVKALAALPGWSDSFKEFALWNWNEKPVDNYIDNGDAIDGSRLSQTPTCMDTHIVPGKDCVLKLGRTNVFLDLGPTSVEYRKGLPDQPIVGLVKFDLTDVRDTAGLGIQAILTLGDDGQTKVEDWTGLSERAFCITREDLRKVVLVISNSKVESGQKATGTIKVDSTQGSCSLGHYSIDLANVAGGVRTGPAPGHYEGDGPVNCTVRTDGGPWVASANYYVDDPNYPAHEIKSFGITSSADGQSSVAVKQLIGLDPNDGPGWFLNWNNAIKPTFTITMDDQGAVVTVHAIANDGSFRVEISATCSNVIRG